jgi:hypothetical protein|tara:strand:+ start:779 stop:1285 length:507 start_codon:yes stop_codon:yes gene_type:complete
LKSGKEFSVRLEWFEVSVALHIAGLRHAMSVRDKRKDNHGYQGRDLQDNLYGVLGEMAVAKLKNFYFPATVDTFKNADLGKNIQVRTVGSNRNRNLIVRPDDSCSDVFVLVEIIKKEGYYDGLVHGWIWGKDAKRDDWLSNFGQPHRPSAYRVPTSELNEPNIAELKL